MNERELNEAAMDATTMAVKMLSPELAKRVNLIVEYVRTLQAQVKGLREALTNLCDGHSINREAAGRAALTATAPEDES